VREALLRQRVDLRLYKDQVIWEEQEVLTQMGKPYGVFTPYMRAWLAKLTAQPTSESDSRALLRTT
jgi:deoxyribodipyrimidine photo-lyase